MSVEIVRPATGQVTLTLSYEDAEIVTRLIGLANSKNLADHSPTLFSTLADLLDEYGRTGEGRYGVRVNVNQAYIYDRENPPF